MTTATDQQQQPAKRTRFEAQPATTAPSDAAQPPKALAESFIKANIASLHPQLATIVESLGKEHILLLSKKDNLHRVHQRMVDDPDFIPRSARIQFQLKGSSRAVELAEYKQLAEETSTLVTEFTTKLKEKIIKASAIEKVAAVNEIRLHLTKCLRIITSAYMIINNDTSNVDSKVYSLMTHYRDHLSVNAPMTLRTFIATYKEVHTIETFPPSTTATATTAAAPSNAPPTTSPYFRSEETKTNDNNDTTMEERQPIIPEDLKEIKTIIEKSFVTSWLRFTQQQQKNKIALELKKLTTSYFTEKSTTASVLPVDSEPAADKKELQALIHLETVKETKNLNKQLDALKKELLLLKNNSKNIQQRGRGGASNKQTNTPTTSKKKSSKKKTASQKQNSKNKNAKVAENNKEKGNGKQNSNKQHGKQQSKKKNSKSNKRQQQGSKKSNKK